MQTKSTLESTDSKHANRQGKRQSKEVEVDIVPIPWGQNDSYKRDLFLKMSTNLAGLMEPAALVDFLPLQ